MLENWDESLKNSKIKFDFCSLRKLLSRSSYYVLVSRKNYIVNSSKMELKLVNSKDILH